MMTMSGAALKNLGEVEEKEQKRRNWWTSSHAELKVGLFCLFVFSIWFHEYISLLLSIILKFPV